MRDRTVEIMWQAIDALDFSRMKAKLLHQKQHAQWTPESLESAEAGYRQFLKMAAKYPARQPFPASRWMRSGMPTSSIRGVMRAIARTSLAMFCTMIRTLASMARKMRPAC